MLNTKSVDSSNEISSRITFRDFDSSDAVSFVVQDHINSLERYRLNIQSCDVVLSLPHKHAHKKAAYHVEIRLHIPGETIVVMREPEKDDTHSDIYVAIRDAFDALERKLETFLDKKRGFVKKHEVFIKTQTEVSDEFSEMFE